MSNKALSTSCPKYLVLQVKFEAPKLVFSLWFNSFRCLCYNRPWHFPNFHVYLALWGKNWV